jgi:hypothetical protein
MSMVENLRKCHTLEKIFYNNPLHEITNEY